MEEKYLVSIIVPVYNVEEYLEKCVNSIVNQTYKNIEIILVDDGSKDNSGMLCDKFANDDSRIKVIHKKNGGLSDARNCGIAAASGKYFLFVDSDDWIDLDTVQKAIKNAIKYNSDVVIYGIIKEYDNGTKKVRIPSVNGCFNNIAALAYFNSFKSFDVSVCNKMFKSELFMNIKFPIGKICEDFYTTYKLFSISKKISVLPEAKYHYFQRVNSITHNDKINMDFVYAAKEQMEFISESFPILDDVGKSNYAFSLLTIYTIKVFRGIKDKNEEIKEARKFKSNVMKNKYLSFARKIQFLLFVSFTPIYNMYIKVKG